MKAISRPSSKPRVEQIVPPPVLLVIGAVSAIYTSTGYVFAHMHSSTAVEKMSLKAFFIAFSLIVVILQTFLLINREKYPIMSFITTAFMMLCVMFALESRTLAHTPLYIFSVITFSIHVRERIFILLISLVILIELTFQFILLNTSRELIKDNLISKYVTIFINTLFAYAVYISIGRMIAAYRTKISQFHFRFRNIEKEHQKNIQKIVIHERRQMARELHDITAHHLTGIVVQSNMALKLYENNVEKIPELLTSILSEAEKSLESLRQIVGILRLDSGFDTTPQPNINNINDLIDDFRKNISEIQLEQSGSFNDLSNVVQLACYRIVEESLSNVVKHAPNSSVKIFLTASNEKISFNIINTHSEMKIDEKSHGFGLIGMAERVELLGGVLKTGPTPEGGWQVCGYISRKDQN